MKDKPVFAVVFMFVLTAVCSFILIGLARLTSGHVKANEQLAFETAVIKAFPQIQGTSQEEPHTLFLRDFVKTKNDAVYLYQPQGKLSGYAIAIEGKGFWDKIRCVIGIAADQKTITGIYFYEQAETPGLGARITEPAFYEQFSGKTLADGDRPLRIRQAGSVIGQSDVAAVTGATQTCIRVETMINDALAAWKQEPVQ